MVGEEVGVVGVGADDGRGRPDGFLVRDRREAVSRT